MELRITRFDESAFSEQVKDHIHGCVRFWNKDGLDNFIKCLNGSNGTIENRIKAMRTPYFEWLLLNLKSDLMAIDVFRSTNNVLQVFADALVFSIGFVTAEPGCKSTEYTVALRIAMC